MSADRAQIDDLRRQARALPHGSTEVALYEEAVRMADSLNDEALSYQVRQELMEAAAFSGRPDALVVAFSWNLARYDKDPSKYNASTLLWEYKWVVSNVLEFPEIPLSKVLELHEDMERRFREYKASMHAPYYLMRGLYRFIGDDEKARTMHARLGKVARGSLSDCAACVVNGNLLYHRQFGQWARAVKAAEPVLDGGLGCAEEPHHTLGNVLLPLLHLGRLDEARDHHELGYRLVRGKTQFYIQHANHLTFATLVGDDARAKGMLERHLADALDAVSPADRFEFLVAARLWALRMAEKGKKTLKLRLPESVPAELRDGPADVAALGKWFEGQAREIADRFDERNGTDAFSKRLDAVPDLLRLAIEKGGPASDGGSAP